ncbi:MAG TPA: sugar ABC transporter permease, partial [Rugosimonospora sp.]|nr:sugar ABC transporter permease [Rugosimonospora sp.]
YWRQYLAISPFFLVFTGFSLIPVIFTLYIGFQHWDGLGPMRFVGLRQFRFLVRDHTFWLALENTVVIWVLATFPMLFLSLVLAVMINSVARLSTFYRIAYFIPNVTSLVAVAIFFFAIFSSQFGIANATLRAAHLPQVPWLSDFWLIKVVIAGLMTWQWTGYNMIIYLAGLQAIPTELYEAARIDGANAVQVFFRITVPLLRPIILFTVIVSTITGLQSFTEPQVMFGSTAAMNPDSGGPGQAGLTLMLYFYNQAFDNHDYGYGAAIVWALFLLIMLFVVINWRLVARRDGGTS